MLYIRRSPIWPDPRVKPPYGAARLNRMHPRAQGLAFAPLFYGGFGAVDLAYGRRSTPVNAPVMGVSADGSCVDFPSGGSAHQDFAEPVDAPFVQREISMAWRGVVRSSGTYHALAGKHAGNGAVDSPFEFRITPTLTVSILRSDASASRSWDGSATLTLGVSTTVGVSGPIGSGATQYAIFVNAVRELSAGQADLTPTGTGADIYVGRRPDGGTQHNGVCVYLFVWSRLLLDEEMVAQHFEPYAMLMPVVRRRYFILAAAEDSIVWVPGPHADPATSVDMVP